MTPEWSYSAGQRATSEHPTSKVRVFERADRDGLWLKKAWGEGVTKLPSTFDREKAVELADELALERQLQHIRGTALDKREHVTLSDLFSRYMDSERAEGWSDKHRADQKRANTFWMHEMGKSTSVVDLTPARVERVMGKAGRRNEWSKRTRQKYLAHLHAAVNWGFRKARLYEENPILGLERPQPDPDTSGLTYTPEEARKLLTPHDKVDWRVTLAANIACDTGRRLSAIRRIQQEDLKMAGERLVVRFRSETDKGGKWSDVPVSSDTARLVADALEREMCEKSPYLLPAGRVGFDEHHDKPVGPGSLIEMLHKAEDELEVEQVKNRGFHGFKRLHVTLGFEVSGGDASLVGDVTGTASPDLLREVYRQQDTGRISRQVDAVRERLEGAE